MTLEIFFSDLNIYQTMGLKSILCQQYDGDLTDIHFLSSDDEPLADSARIIFRNDVITMNLPPVPESPSGLCSTPPVMTWHIPFLSRKCPVEDIALKIKKILSILDSSGNIPCPEILRNFRHYTQLSDTEYQVMILIGKGMNNQDISKVLNRSEKTISAHYRNVSRKMGAANRAEFYRYACFISRFGGDRRNTLFL